MAPQAYFHPTTLDNNRNNPKQYEQQSPSPVLSNKQKSDKHTSNKIANQCSQKNMHELRCFMVVAEPFVHLKAGTGVWEKMDTCVK